jgi:diguanylate cyclase (GGDEF)-like protein
MAEGFGDARLEEVKLLSEIDRMAEVKLTPPPGPERDLVAYLVWGGFVNDLHSDGAAPDPRATGSGIPGESGMERELHMNRLVSLHAALSGREVTLRLTHRGRVRLSELKQALRSGKAREPFGILWDKRHFDTDLRMAVVEAGPAAPVSVANFDMNGMKAVNDQCGHAAGDLALRAYFTAVADALGSAGDAYRVGGDEVVAILRGQDTKAATASATRACRLLAAEMLEFGGRTLPPVSLSVGVATTTDPHAAVETLVQAADAEMYRAKEEAHRSTPNPSVIARQGEPGLIKPAEVRP